MLNCGFTNSHQHLDMVLKHRGTMKNKNISVFEGRKEQNFLLPTYINTYKHTRKPILFLEYISVTLR